MKIHAHTRDICFSCRPFVSMGAFDGLHLGHRALFEWMKQEARQAKVETVVVIFSPHPRRVLEPFPNTRLNLLTSLPEKQALIAQAGIDHLVILPFTKELSALDYEAFVEEYLWNPLKMQRYFAGHDHGFGRGRAGGFEALLQLGQRLGFSVSRLEPVEMDGLALSSTRVREILAQGNVAEARRLLGYFYTLRGTVISGKAIGKTIGYPTANIQPDDPDKMIPRHGVYAVRVSIGDTRFLGMMNIGVRPTLSQGEPSIEIHIFHFEGNIYGSELSIQFIARIRDEQKFENLQALREQLDKDKDEALTYLENAGEYG